LNNQNWLLNCIERNKNTEYGKIYNFKNIQTISDFQKEVPLTTYEDISTYIKKISNGEENILFNSKAVAFEKTGGSSSGGKLIPYSKDGLEDFQKAIYPWLASTQTQFDIDFSKTYFSISPALRKTQYTPSKIKIGVDDSAYLGDAFASTLNNGMAIPTWVAELKDLDKWQLATLYHLVCAKDLELISIWSPTFLLMLLNILDQKKDQLKSYFLNGSEIDGNILKPDKEAYKRLERYLTENNTSILWPNLKLISCWCDAMSKPFSKKLESQFKHAKIQPKGLISTEGVVSIPDDEDFPILQQDKNFYEFLDQDGKPHLPSELKKDNTYEVVLTTNSGLYRYKTGDVVRFEGIRSNCAVVRFIGRSGIVSDIVGEKLNEVFVQNVLNSIGEFSMIVAKNTIEDPRYILLGESNNIKDYLSCVENKLLTNPQYAYARKIGQLKELEVKVMDNALVRYVKYKTESGSRVGDIKIPSLQSDRQWLEIIQRESK